MCAQIQAWLASGKGDVMMFEHVVSHNSKEWNDAMLKVVDDSVYHCVFTFFRNAIIEMVDTFPKTKPEQNHAELVSDGKVKNFEHMFDSETVNEGKVEIEQPSSDISTHSKFNEELNFKEQNGQGIDNGEELHCKFDRLPECFTIMDKDKKPIYSYDGIKVEMIMSPREDWSEEDSFGCMGRILKFVLDEISKYHASSLLSAEQRAEEHTAKLRNRKDHAQKDSETGLKEAGDRRKKMREQCQNASYFLSLLFKIGWDITRCEDCLALYAMFHEGAIYDALPLNKVKSTDAAASDSIMSVIKKMRYWVSMCRIPADCYVFEKSDEEMIKDEESKDLMLLNKGAETSHASVVILSDSS